MKSQVAQCCDLLSDYACAELRSTSQSQPSGLSAAAAAVYWKQCAGNVLRTTTVRSCFGGNLSRWAGGTTRVFDSAARSLVWLQSPRQQSIQVAATGLLLHDAAVCEQSKVQRSRQTVTAVLVNAKSASIHS